MRGPSDPRESRQKNRGPGPGEPPKETGPGRIEKGERSKGARVWLTGGLLGTGPCHPQSISNNDEPKKRESAQRRAGCRRPSL